MLRVRLFSCYSYIPFLYNTRPNPLVRREEGSTAKEQVIDHWVHHRLFNLFLLILMIGIIFGDSSDSNDSGDFSESNDSMIHQVIYPQSPHRQWVSSCPSSGPGHGLCRHRWPLRRLWPCLPWWDQGCLAGGTMGYGKGGGHFILIWEQHFERRVQNRVLPK